MLRYLGQRLLALLPTVAVPLILVFLLLRLAPGDPAAILLGDSATPEQVAELREQLGLNAPIWAQFGRFVLDVVTFQLGDSIFLAKPVVDVIPAYAIVTLEISLIALVVALVLGVGFGALAAFRDGRPAGRIATATGIIGISVPQFVVALILIVVFAAGLRWFNVGGFVPLSQGFLPHLRSITLPALALGIAESAFVARITRGAILDVIREPFVTTARSLGVAPARIGAVHVVRVAALPIITVAGLLVASLLSGSAVIETIFGVPGMGRLLLDAVGRRDYSLVQGIVLFTGVFVILVNLLVDLYYAVVDPRVRLGRKSA
ncbi:ABC transporter permease [Microbacterium sp. KSW4-11]|uniref:ABC transporter permease n=1 Tax=Microbacterium gawkjiense TaxID=3067309 RepID=A0ABU3GB00_9MICO|nr:ABC transporter permease [Microbacterium sp. KSW4-11]MDT3316217.1 ABC transporter permease [Microbacterium sp. KSW4-11]